MDKPQIIVYSTIAIPYTAYDIKWIPATPRFIILGQNPNGSGIIQVKKLSQGAIEQIAQTEKPFAFKCGTFGASSLAARELATGDFGGRLCIWDIERLEKPIIAKNAHSQIINCIDGFGGKGFNCGPPEIVTGSRDGLVKVWDVRQKEGAVAVLGPENGSPSVDPWAVSFGNSYNNEERMIAAGYENGDLKLFDLRAMKLTFEVNLKNGICSLEFDRKDIKMNKLVATGLESKFHVFDLRTFNESAGGYTYMSQKLSKDNTTGWVVKHLPQNREVFVMSSGSGQLDVLKYEYPVSRVKKDDKGNEVGVTGKVVNIQNAVVADQPVGAFDWSPDKLGLCAFAGYDQQIRVGMVTRLSTI